MDAKQPAHTESPRRVIKVIHKGRCDGCKHYILHSYLQEAEGPNDESDDCSGVKSFYTMMEVSGYKMRYCANCSTGLVKSCNYELVEFRSITKVF